MIALINMERFGFDLMLAGKWFHASEERKSNELSDLAELADGIIRDVPFLRLYERGLT